MANPAMAGAEPVQAVQQIDPDAATWSDTTLQQIRAKEEAIEAKDMQALLAIHPECDPNTATAYSFPVPDETAAQVNQRGLESAKAEMEAVAQAKQATDAVGKQVTEALAEQLPVEVGRISATQGTVLDDMSARSGLIRLCVPTGDGERQPADEVIDAVFGEGTFANEGLESDTKKCAKMYQDAKNQRINSRREACEAGSAKLIQHVTEVQDGKYTKMLGHLTKVGEQGPEVQAVLDIAGDAVARKTQDEEGERRLQAALAAAGQTVEAAEANQADLMRDHNRCTKEALQTWEAQQQAVKGLEVSDCRKEACNLRLQEVKANREALRAQLAAHQGASVTQQAIHDRCEATATEQANIVRSKIAKGRTELEAPLMDACQKLDQALRVAGGLQDAACKEQEQELSVLRQDQGTVQAEQERLAGEQQRSVIAFCGSAGARRKASIIVKDIGAGEQRLVNLGQAKKAADARDDKLWAGLKSGGVAYTGEQAVREQARQRGAARAQECHPEFVLWTPQPRFEPPSRAVTSPGAPTDALAVRDQKFLETMKEEWADERRRTEQDRRVRDKEHKKDTEDLKKTVEALVAKLAESTFVDLGGGAGPSAAD